MKIWRPFSRPQRATLTEPLVIEEVTALLRYASEAGMASDGDLFGKLNQAVAEYEAADEVRKAQLRGAVLTLYSALVSLTKPVNGRTLLDTQRVNSHLLGPLVLTGCLLSLGIANEILSFWFQDQIEPSEGWPRVMLDFRTYILDYLTPFVWGGLGACVYLLKKLYDIAAERAFDRSRLHGWYLRVILGAIFGAVVRFIYDPSSFVGNGINLDANAVAFFTGIGVKVIYGAIESTIIALSERMNLDNVRRERIRSSVVDQPAV